jgi:excisionase family DNA binding protein
MALTVKQAAARLDASKSSIYQMCKVGKLPHYRVGVKRGTIRIEEKDVDAIKQLQNYVNAGHLPMILKHIRLETPGTTPSAET